MTRVVLVGGIYGSGKSTTAVRLANAACAVGYRTVVVDYDDLAEAGKGEEIDLDKTNRLRYFAWEQDGFVNAVKDVVSQEPDLVVASGTFSTRQRRERFTSQLDDGFYDINVYGLFIMEPMRDTISRIENNRVDNTRLVNAERWREFYQRYNRTFKDEDNTDLLLPSNKNLLAPEYRALLTKGEQNREAFLSSDNTPDKTLKWVVLPRPLRVDVFLEIIKDGIYKPFDVRERLEGLTSTNIMREGNYYLQKERR